MRMTGFVQGGVEQCFTKIWKLGQGVANMRQESEVGDGAAGIDGVWVDRDVVWVLCKLFLQLNQRMLGKSET